jgi:putative tryptophan/tyrosine transport system substrate-binding protein
VSGLSRRGFVRGVGVASAALVAGCTPPWQAPPPAAKVPRVGYLLQSALETSTTVQAFRQGLREQGLLEGVNVTVEYRAANGAVEQLPALAAELVRTGVDLIVAAPPSAPAHAAKNATSTLPIVMLGPTNPVREGLVASLARPGGNITGLSASPGPGMIGKRLELLETVTPGLSRVAVLWQPGDPNQDEAMPELLEAARSMAIEVQFVPVHDPEEFEATFEVIRRDGAGGILTLGTMFQQYRTRIAELALQSKLPSIASLRDYADAGGLMGYGHNYVYNARRGAVYVDKILRGALPADLPVEQPHEYDFVINLRTARALGLTIPEAVLVRATEVIP